MGEYTPRESDKLALARKAYEAEKQTDLEMTAIKERDRVLKQQFQFGEGAQYPSVGMPVGAGALHAPSKGIMSVLFSAQDEIVQASQLANAIADMLGVESQPAPSTDATVPPVVTAIAGNNLFLLRNLVSRLQQIANAI